MLINMLSGIIALFFSMQPLLHYPRQLRPHLVWFPCLVLVAGLSACGPAASDHSPNQGGRGSLGMPSDSQLPSQQTPSLPKVPFTPATNLAPLTVNQRSVAALPEERTLQPEYLTLPTWMAQALVAPDAVVRLQALDAWVQQGPKAPLDPLIVALDDEDDDVREKAMAIIEWQWAALQEEKYQAAK